LAKDNIKCFAKKYHYHFCCRIALACVRLLVLANVAATSLHPALAAVGAATQSPTLAVAVIPAATVVAAKPPLLLPSLLLMIFLVD
jgi:hypothetical protein